MDVEDFAAAKCFHILEAIDEFDYGELDAIAKRLKETDGASWAVGELLERAIETHAILVDPESAV